MDPRASKDKESVPPRRSTRQSTGKAVSYEPTRRSPLRRTKRSFPKPPPAEAVNGSRDKENGSEDEEPPKKIHRETGEAAGGSDDEIEMDDLESAEDEEDNQEQEMHMERQEPSHITSHHRALQDASGDVNLSPYVVLRERCKSGHAVNEDADWRKTKTVKQSAKEPATPTKPTMQSKGPAKTHALKTDIAEYQRKMKAKANSAALDRANYSTSRICSSPQHVHVLRDDTKRSSERVDPKQHFNNIQRESVKKKQDKEMKKTTNIKKSSGYLKGFIRVLLSLAFLVMLGFAGVMVYKDFPVLQRIVDGAEQVSSSGKPEVFVDGLSVLMAQFPSQRPELWRRSKIHLERHLRTDQPTEPVSLIFTAGSKADQTLRCLAQGLASTFSSALNGSVLHIDGASIAGQDSDAVKLDIDSQLRAAFEGDKPVAVIHRLEELPPGSTLIFYRYCDHESAAYKRVFLLFTVLLPQDEISGDKSLKDVEEMVQDYVKEKLVDSRSQTSFNEMDIDKYGGLWSRISHLILPVVSEKEIEQTGC